MIPRVLDNFPKSGQKQVAIVDASKLTEKTFLREFVDINLPVLITNAVKEWPATKLWNMESYLSKSCGHYKVAIYKHANYVTQEKMIANEEVKLFSDALKYFNESKNEVISIPAIYILENGDFGELLDDIPDFPFLKKPPKPIAYTKNRFFYYRNAGTSWHSHPFDETLLCQISGGKEVGLIKPSLTNHNTLKSVFKKEKYLEDATELEALSIAEDYYRVTVKEGDALYIPPFWWHGVDPIGTDKGVSLARCWRSPMHKLGDLKYPHVREIWKEAFMHPNKNTLPISVLGSMSFLAQAYRFVSKPLRSTYS